MTSQPPTDIPPPSAPLVPFYPFNEPGQGIVLHDGPIGGLLDKDLPGRVELACAPSLGLGWKIFPEPGDYTGSGEVTLILRRTGGDMALPAGQRNREGGWSNGAEFGDPTAPLVRVVAHWFNLPELGSPVASSTAIQTPDEYWDGRWRMVVGNWQLAVSRRPDYKDAWKDLHLADVYVMTHVAEIRKLDGTTFTAAEVEPFLDALQVGVSFGLGRWVAVALPVGLDHGGDVVWQQWRPSLCDPARAIQSGWWNERRLDALHEFLTCVMAVFADPDQLPALRLQLMFATSAVSDRGFMEQRIMMGGAGLEHIMWQLLVVGGRLTRKQYKDEHAHVLLRQVLGDAQIPIDIDPQVLPVLTQFVAEETVRQGRALDGPDVVTQVRNRLVHPEGTQERVYRLDGLLTEAWALARHYLALLILHTLGYNGPYRDLRSISGSVHDVGTVPWA